MQAIDALTRGFKDGGCEYVTNFPGFHSHKIFSRLGRENISLNEKMAYEKAFGASLAGKRAVVSMKNVGLNVAADPFLNSILAGVNAGLVLVVTDDVEVTGSQSRQDSRHYRDFFGGLWLEPNSISSAYDMAYESFKYPEQVDTPVVIRLTNQFFGLAGAYQRRPSQTTQVGIANNPNKFIVHPTNWRDQARKLVKKQKEAARIAEEISKVEQLANDQPSKGMGAIVFGNCQRELEYLRRQESNLEVMSINTYPLPTTQLKAFVEGKEKLFLLEQGDSHALELFEKALVQEASIHPLLISNTGQTPNIDDTYRTWGDLSRLFRAIRKLSPGYVVSDLTQFTRETSGTVQACLCLGASIPIGIGLAESGIDYPICVVGDVSFLHTGTDVVREASARDLNLGIIVIDNGGSWCTGGQYPLIEVPWGDMGVSFLEVEYSNADETEFCELLEDMRNSGGVHLLKICT